MNLTYEQAAKLAELANILRPDAASALIASPEYLDGYLAGIEQAARILRDAQLIVGEVMNEDPPHPHATVERYFAWYQDAVDRAQAAEEERDQAIDALRPFATCPDLGALFQADMDAAKVVYARITDRTNGDANG